MKRYKLSDIAKEVTVRENNPADSEYRRFVGLEHYEQGEIVIRKYGSTNDVKSAMKVFCNGDVLVARRNVYLRRAAIVNFDGLTSGDSIVLRANNDKLSLLLPFILNTSKFWSFAEQNSDGTMSKRLSPKKLMDYEFNLPSDREQDRIIELLWSIDRTRQAYRQLLFKTDELVKSQFIEMFGTAQSNEKGWPVMSMKEASERLSDGPFGSNLKSEHYRQEGVRVIRLQNICDGFFLDDDKAYVGLEHYEKIKKYTCHAGDIVIGTLGDPNLRACLIPDSIDISINKADCVHYIPREDLLDKRFVCAFINSPATLKMAIGEAHGNTRQRISSGQLAKLPIIIPPMELQREYAAFVEQSDKSKLEIQKALTEISLVNKHIICDCLS